MLAVGLIGYGHWGPKLARCLAAAPGASLAGICDLSAERLALAAATHPRARSTPDWQELVADSRIDAVAVATPAALHAPIALAALRQGKHVLVEKPLARSLAEASALVDESRRRNRVLLVDHTFLFSPPVTAIRDLLAAGRIGAPCRFDAVRAGPGIVRSDVNVIWDLAVHDLSILDHVLPQRPRSVQASGPASGDSGLEQVADITLRFDGPFVAHIHVSWRAPAKTRRLTIGGARGTLTYDDLDPEAQVRVQDDVGGDWSPPLAGIEPLAAVAEHFADCIRNGRRPLSGGATGLRIARLADAACRSLARGGEPIELDAEESAAA
jgi:predicted dehydrogenase